MTDEDEKKKLIEAFRERYQKEVKQDPERAKKLVRDMFIMNRATRQAQEMPKEEALARGFINSLLGIFGKGERSEVAKARGMGFLNQWMFEQATKHAKEKGMDTPLDAEKTEVDGEVLTKAFNEEMEEHEIAVAARQEGEDIEIAAWDTDEGDEKQ